MMSKLWQWLAAGAGGLVVALYVALQWVTRQRDKAQDKAERQKKRAEVAETRTEKMRHAKQKREEITSLERDDLDDRLRRWHREDD